MHATRDAELERFADLAETVGVSREDFLAAHAKQARRRSLGARLGGLRSLLTGLLVLGLFIGIQLDPRVTAPAPAQVLMALGGPVLILLGGLRLARGKS